MHRGYIQLYTGNGKGKTTAAIGLAVRALGAGLSVFMGQFVKGMHYSELDALKVFAPRLVLKQYGRDCFIRNAPTEEDIRLAREGFAEIKQVVFSGGCDLVIMDEITIANYYKLIRVEAVLEILENRPSGVELVLTGRYADERLIKAADLVTEMMEVKHYYTRNVQARDGIEK